MLVLGGLAAAGWEKHWPPAVFGRTGGLELTWSAAQASLPAGTAQTSSQFASLNDVSCPRVRSCVAVGQYNTGGSNGSSGDTHGLIETLADGAWTPAVAPVSVTTNGQVTYFTLDGVSCPAQGACVAVGGYYDSANVETPLAETLSGGTWTSARPGLPGDADPSKGAFLGEISCPAPGTCVATGWYTDRSGDLQGLIDTLSGGTWTPLRAPLPAGAVPRASSSSSLPTALFVVRCPAVGSCVATGDYATQNGGNQGLIDTLSGGTWTPLRAPLPGDAVAGNPAAYVWGIACSAPGACLAVGHYNSRNGQSRSMIDTLSGGTWTPAAASLPADAAAKQKWSLNQLTGLTAVGCAASGACVAAGSYFARDGSIQGVIETQSGGGWTVARARLPAGAATTKQYAFYNTIACPSSSDCVAVGGYKITNGGTLPMIDTATSAGST